VTAGNRRVYLVRHARAEKDPAHDDASRPLSGEGRTRFRAHARALAGEIRLTRIVTSPFLRARQTADLLAEATGAEVEEEARLASGASDGEGLLALARSLGDGAALVGHNPELAEAIRLAAGGDVEVKPGTVAAVDVHGRVLRVAWLRPAP
jgi:phosphohistidine phosphatase